MPASRPQEVLKMRVYEPGEKPELRPSAPVCQAAAGLHISPSPVECRDNLPGFCGQSLPHHEPGRLRRRVGGSGPVLQPYAGAHRPPNRAYERDFMTKKHSPANVPGNLRVRAEKLLAAGGLGLRQLPPDDVLQLVHELQVHQIELEMQNEELRRAQETITETGNRYADLYDFAPVGYVLSLIHI